MLRLSKVQRTKSEFESSRDETRRDEVVRSRVSPLFGTLCHVTKRTHGQLAPKHESRAYIYMHLLPFSDSNAVSPSRLLVGRHILIVALLPAQPTGRLDRILNTSGQDSIVSPSSKPRIRAEEHMFSWDCCQIRLSLTCQYCSVGCIRNETLESVWRLVSRHWLSLAARLKMGGCNEAGCQPAEAM